MTDETNLLVYYNVLNKALNPRKFYESIITIDPSNITPNKVLPTKIFDYNSIIFNYANCGHDIITEYYNYVYKFANVDIAKYSKETTVIEDKIREMTDKLTLDSSSSYKFYNILKTSNNYPNLSLTKLLRANLSIGQISPETSDNYNTIFVIYSNIYNIYNEILASKNSYALYDILNFSWIFRNYFFDGNDITEDSNVDISSNSMKSYDETSKFLVSMLGFISYINYANKLEINNSPMARNILQVSKKYLAPTLREPEKFIKKVANSSSIAKSENSQLKQDCFDDYKYIYAMFYDTAIKYDDQLYIYNLAIIFVEIAISLYTKVELDINKFITDKLIKPFLEASGIKNED